MESERLIFKPFEEADFEDYFKLTGEEEVMKMISGALSRKKAVEKFKKVLSLNRSNPDIGVYRIENKASQKYIGLGKIVITEGHEAEIGYALVPEEWRKGYGSEISQKLVNYSKTIDYIHDLIAIIDPENTASQRILEKCGFTLDRLGNWKGLPAAYYKQRMHHK